MSDRPKQILYVDDDADDREILSTMIRDVNPNIEVVLVEDGTQAMDYLNSHKTADSQLPDLIVLDNNMPFLNGVDTLKCILKDETLNKVPVIVFSSSEKPSDKTYFNKMGVEYLVKPTSMSYMRSIASRMVLAL